MSDDSNQIGDYQLISIIATSSTSQVWEVAEASSGRRLAMKLLLPTAPNLAEAKAVLKHEANVGKVLQHPNIIKFEKYSAGRDATYLVMEYFRAVNIKLQIKGEISSVQMRMKAFCEGTCQALYHMHEHGWIHRDFKPENVLMNKAGEVRLLDFSLSLKHAKGLSKMLGGKPKIIQGTRTYIAPETIRKQAPTPQTDMYSYGVTLYEMLTGRVPFAGSTPEDLLKKHLSAPPPPPSSMNPNVTPELDRVVVRLMQKRIENRYKDMMEVNAELKRIRFFKEEVVPQALNNDQAEKEKLMQTVGETQVDSRADAMRQELFRANPELGRQHAEQQAINAAAREAKKRKLRESVDKNSKGKGGPSGANTPPNAAPAGAALPPGVGGPGGPPSWPGGYMPPPGQPANPYGMPPGGMPQPGMPMNYPPGMPMPSGAGYPPGAYPPGGLPPNAFPSGAFPPGYGGPPGAAAMTPPGYPPQYNPGQPMPSAGPQTPRPATPVPAQRAAATPQKPAPAAQPKKSPPNEDDLEYMTELPDIL